jgi:alpha-1,2-mannosyltransferase
MVFGRILRGLRLGRDAERESTGMRERPRIANGHAGKHRPILRHLWVALWSIAAFIAVLRAWGGLGRPWTDRLSDLQVYLGGVNSLRSGHSLYDFAAVKDGAPFTYPPFAGLVFLPIAGLNTTVLMVAWSVFTIAAAVVIATLCRRVAASCWRLPDGLALPTLVVLLFLSAPISSNLRFGQVSIFLALMVLVDALKVTSPRFAGVATGVAAAIKLTPLIFIPYLWFAGQRRAAATALGTFVAVTGLTWLILPGESRRYWTVEILDVKRVGNIVTGGNQSLNGVLMRIGITDGTRSAVVALLGGAVVLIALWRGAHAARAGHLLAGAVIVGAAGLVFSPVSWTRHQIWLILAAAVPLEAGVRGNRIWAATAALLMILPVTSIGAGLPGGVIWGNARFWLAIAVACAIPFAGTKPLPDSWRRVPAAARPPSGRRVPRASVGTHD